MPANEATRPLRPLLRRLGACPAAIDWAGKQAVCEATYAACPDGTWLTWLADALGVDQQPVYDLCPMGLSQCRCAVNHRETASLFRSKIPYAAFEAALQKWEAARAPRD